MDSPLRVIEAFYKARASGDLDGVGQFIADDVQWIEPTVGDHMGELRGKSAVIDMMRRAGATTGGTFSLAVTDGIEVDGHCSVVIEWSAEKAGRVIRGRELATYSVVNDQIVFAQFLPENIQHDNAFWAADQL